MRKLLISIFAAFCACGAFARIPSSDFLQRLNFSLEWGYTQDIFKHQHYNIVSEEGYRIDETQNGFYFHPNGELMVGVGYDIGKNFDIALCSGYIGVSEGYRMYPVLTRISVFPNSVWEDGFFGFVDGGIGLAVPAGIQTSGLATLADAGGGYRMKLTPYCNLDVMLKLKFAFSSPNIPNPEGPGYVSEHNIRTNNAGYYALNLSVAINF